MLGYVHLYIQCDSEEGQRFIRSLDDLQCERKVIASSAVGNSGVLEFLAGAQSSSSCRRNGWSMSDVLSRRNCFPPCFGGCTQVRCLGERNAFSKAITLPLSALPHHLRTLPADDVTLTGWLFAYSAHHPQTICKGTLIFDLPDGTITHVWALPGSARDCRLVRGRLESRHFSWTTRAERDNGPCRYRIWLHWIPWPLPCFQARCAFPHPFEPRHTHPLTNPRKQPKPGRKLLYRTARRTRCAT